MRNKLFIILTLCALSTPIWAQKIVAYFPSYRNPSTVQYNKCTDIIFAFIQPQSDGNIELRNEATAGSDFGFDMNKFLEVKERCRAANVNLHIAIGGASSTRSSRLSSVIATTTGRTNLSNSIVNFAIEHGLAGIDLDWEFPGQWNGDKNNLDLFLSTIRTKINNTAPHLKLSIAVGGEYNGNPDHLDFINNSAFQYIDFAYIMAYDFSSGYDWFNHSTRTVANSSMTAWNTFGLPYNKMILGVPFYGKTQPRSSTLAYNAIPDNQFPTAFTSDTYSGYYYNGKTTLEGKIEDVFTKGALGVMIWDIGQDRTDQYSLLGAIYDKMVAKCGAARIDLGSDNAFCSSKTLNTNISSGGLTFAWTRNGTSTGGNTSTLSITQSGTYKVTATKTGCSISDEIIMTTTSATTVSSNSVTTSCPGETANLSVTGGTPNTYEWYSASTGGKLLQTGTSYAPSPSSTTTYYVQSKLDNKLYYAGKTTMTVASAWAEWGATGALPTFGQKLTVEKTLNLKSVYFYPNTTTLANVKVMIIGSDGNSVVASTTPFNYSGFVGEAKKITVNQSLDPGTYYIGVYASDASSSGSGRIQLLSTAGATTNESGIYTLEGACYKNNGSGFNVTASTYYGQLFNIELETSPVTPCNRTAVVVTVSGGSNPNLTVSGNDVCTGNNGTVTINSSENTVSYQAYIGATAVGSAVSGNGGNINLSIPSGNLTSGANSISLKATKGACSAITLNNNATVNVLSTPIISGNIAGATSPTLGSTGNNYSISSVSGATSYSWSYNGTGASLSGATNNGQSIDFASNSSTGTLSVTASNQCGTSSAKSITITPQEQTVSPTNGSISNNQAYEIYAFPNPFVDNTTLELNLKNNGDIKIVILNAIGQEVKELNNQYLSSGKYLFPISLPYEGIYFVKTSMNNQTNIQKIIKTK